MIMRIFRAVVHEGQQEAFQEFFLETALPLVRSQEGLISAQVGLPEEDSPEEFSMLMLWKDLESLKKFTGEEWHEAVILPDEFHLVKEVFVHHYEVADV